MLLGGRDAFLVQERPVDFLDVDAAVLHRSLFGAHRKGNQREPGAVVRG
jgi:hypothetical protein